MKKELMSKEVLSVFNGYDIMKNIIDLTVYAYRTDSGNKLNFVEFKIHDVKPFGYTTREGANELYKAFKSGKLNISKTILTQLNGYTTLVLMRKYLKEKGIKFVLHDSVFQGYNEERNLFSQIIG